MIDQISSVAANAVRPGALAAKTPQTSFTDAMGSLATDVAGTINRAETVSAHGLTGDASVREVAEAVMDAERSLQTALAVRDKATSAWLDISRMSI